MHAGLGDTLDAFRQKYGAETGASTYRPDLYATSYRFEEGDATIDATILPDTVSNLHVVFPKRLPSEEVEVLLERYSGVPGWEQVPTSDPRFARLFPLMDPARVLFFAAEHVGAMVQHGIAGVPLQLYVVSELYPDLLREYREKQKPDGSKARKRYSDQWTKIWSARLEALTTILGKPADTVLHAVIPFQLCEAGGAADVVQFPGHVPGATYVTAELTGDNVGQRPNSLGHYELMICTRKESEKAATFIARLACYTCDAVLEAGETMDIEEYFDDSTLRGVVFAHPGEQPVHFEFLGQRYSLLLCIGITTEELAFARARGSAKLLALLKHHGAFPYTTPNRPTVPLPLRFRWGRIFRGR